MDLRASGDLCFSVSKVSRDIKHYSRYHRLVTMGSYRAIVHFLNSLQTHMKSFFCVVREHVNASQ